MKLGLYSDLHYCESSSLIRNRGEKYSLRIENCLKTLDWLKELFEKYHCSDTICLGDFFDKSTLNAEELTALNETSFERDSYFLVGNHEITKNDNSISSMHILGIDYSKPCIIDKPTFNLINKTGILFLPYIVEDKRKTIKEYIEKYCTQIYDKLIIFSHNDIKGIQYGAYTSEVGFDIKDIEDNCDLFINGHLHNAQFVNDKQTILNIGNITGLNFSEDALKYKHYAIILDTDTLEMEFIENPYAFNFYKLDNIIDNLKDNAVITIKVKESKLEETKKWLEDNKDKIIASRINVLADTSISSEFTSNVELNSIDHLSLFKEFILSNIETTSVLNEELGKVLS